MRKHRISNRSLLILVLCLPGFCHGAIGNSPPVTSSSDHAGDYNPAYAFDGRAETRWASKSGQGEEWIQLDFGESIRFQELSIVWEAAYALQYEVQVSDNGEDWTCIAALMDGAGGTEHLTGLEGKGRWLRILCQRPTDIPLFSIWEISFPEAEPAAAMKAVLSRSRAQQRDALRDALHDTGMDAIVFTTRPLPEDGHWYANFGYFAADDAKKTYAKGGGLYTYNIASEEITPLIEDPEGTVRDPAVHYDGQTILFSWRKPGTDFFNLYTISSDGCGLTQVTFGDFDDIEPAWLPDGGIVFVSSRCRRWVNCWLTQVAVIHRCDADGSNLRPLSANIEHDNTPWPMPDGRILYTRWEYVDRSQVDYHHLWTMNPDGTGQQVFFGNLHPGGVFIDAKPILGTDDVLFINSPGHGVKEHAGKVALVNCKQGPDELGAIRNITGDGYRDPYPLSKEVFLVAREKRLVLLNASGVEETLFKLPMNTPLLVHEPRPLRTRVREAVIPSRVDYVRDTGRLILTDIYAGRSMEGLERGDIKKLLVLESLPKPINYTGGMDPLTYGGSFTLERVLGTVPVAEDGSAYMELPAGRALFFVALDANNDSVKRMQSFLSVMPGETTTCLGCHEHRTAAGVPYGGNRPKALLHPPHSVTPIPGIPEVFDFPRDIQPILDRHCVPCHDYDAHTGATEGPRAGHVILTGDRGPMFSHSFATLTLHAQFVDGRNQPVSNYPPRTLGSGVSPIMKKIRGGHHDVHLSEHEIRMIRFWIESGATYPGTYAALGGGSIGGYYENEPTECDNSWPASMAASEVIDRRCASCHDGMRSLPRHLSDENGLSFWRPEWDDARLMRSRHLVYNLSRPEKSLILMAPLAKESGGFGFCQIPDDTGGMLPVFTSVSDPDYQKLLAMCVAGKERLDTIGRFDMPGFRPPFPYLREMQRYGVIPEIPPPGEAIDFYELDRRYWQSFEQQAALQHPAYTLDHQASGD